MRASSDSCNNASNEGLIVGRPVRHAVLRLIPGMDLRLHPCSVDPAEDHEKCGPNRPTAESSCNNAGERQAGRCHGPARAVHQPDPSALHAPVPPGGRGAADSLSPRVVHGRLPRSAARAAGRRRGRAERDQHRAADRGLGRRVSAGPAARPGRPGLRLCLGRRDSLQYPAGGRPPVYAGGHRRARRRDEGARRARGRVPRKCRELGGAVARAAAPRARGARGRGALGVWSAVRDVWPQTAEQRDWFHKLGNVLDKLPKRLQPNAKRALHNILAAETREQAEDHLDTFVAEYEAKYPKAAACLATDRKALLTFFAFPAEHWIHLRTTNVIESPFATVRLRQRVPKGAGSRTKGLLMAYKVARHGPAAVAATQCRTPAAARAGWCGLHRRSAAGTKHRGGSEGSRLITLIADPQLLTISRATV